MRPARPSTAGDAKALPATLKAAVALSAVKTAEARDATGAPSMKSVTAEALAVRATARQRVPSHTGAEAVAMPGLVTLRRRTR